MTSEPGYGGAGYGRAGYGPQPYGAMAYGGPAGMRAQMRATDADRERVADLLNRAFTEGRLTKDEHDARLGRALSATTYADLDTCMADLMPLPFPAPVQVRTNTLAIISLVCGIGQMILWPLATIPAVVLGHVARHQIKRTGENGAGLALAGLILGWIGTAVLLLGILAVVLLLAAYSTASGHPVRVR
jgi:Domain of unknown function (DUF4190)/DUF1707 SHOCT-like domain